MALNRGSPIPTVLTAVAGFARYIRKDARGGGGVESTFSDARDSADVRGSTARFGVRPTADRPLLEHVGRSSATFHDGEAGIGPHSTTPNQVSSERYAGDGMSLRDSTCLWETQDDGSRNQGCYPAWSRYALP